MSIYTVGCFFGSLSCIWLGDRLSRIRTITLGATLDTIGAILQASPFSLAQLIVGRIVSGLGFGMLTATAPNWQSECSKAEHRGSAVILESVFIRFGLGKYAHGTTLKSLHGVKNDSTSGMGHAWGVIRKQLFIMASSNGTIGSLVAHSSCRHPSVARITSVARQETPIRRRSRSAVRFR